MTFTYSGKVFWANGDPVKDVQVRLFEPNNDHSLGTDLTIQPGLSSDDGTFTILAQDSHFIDNALLEGLDSLSPLFDHLDVHGLSLGNDDRPILQFTYSLKARVVQTLLPFRKLHRGYQLPFNPPVDFIPSRDGFSFENSFNPFNLPITLPSWLGLNRTSDTYGLCGGMSSASYDFRLARCAGGLTPPNIRQYDSVPQTGTRLQRYLLRRSLDTFGEAGQMLIKVGEWTMLPDQGPSGTKKLTLDELPNLHQQLDDGQCVVLTLIYEHAADFKELANKIWDNHQVLAYGFSQINPDLVEIRIYDSNYPDRDDIKLQAQRIQVDGSNVQPVFGLDVNEIIPREGNQPVRGFFPMAYQPASPPP